MQKLFTGLILVIAFQVSGLAQPTETVLTFDSGVKKHPGLDKIYYKFSQAYRELDPEIVAGLYASEAAYLAPGADIKTGRDKILESFTGFFDQIRGQNGRLEIMFRIVQRRVTKDMAYDVGIYTLRTIKSVGETGTDRGKFVVVAVREKSGEWKFQVDGYSGLPDAK